MYGQIHLCIRSLVLEKFGEEKWNQVMTHAGCAGEDFMTFHRYGDNMTMKLVSSVSEVLGAPLEDVLTLFGDYFFVYCYQNGYDKMLKTLGDDFKSFVQNLDSLHALLSFSYKDINAPSFRCEEDDNGQLYLHYYSIRDGLHAIVSGLCRSVGREMFQQDVSLEQIEKDKMQLRNAIIYHVAFRVIIKETKNQQSNLNIGLKASRSNKSTDSSFCTPEGPLITPRNMCEIFPFHVLFDGQLMVKQCGCGITKYMNRTTFEKMKLTDFVRLVKPEMTMTYENIIRFTNSNYILEQFDEEGNVVMKLRGQMVYLQNIEHLLFIGSPRIQTLDEMEERNLFLSDIPLYDVTRELVLLNQQRLAEVEISKKLDETTAELTRTATALDKEKKKTEFLLYQMLPRKVADSLKEGKTVDAEKFDMATILFSDIVTFTNIASAVPPIKVVAMLNNMYKRFDELTETHTVYKVETIGDAYMIVGGVPERTDDHAKLVADFSLDMIAQARKVLSPATGKPLQIRVGFHSGPVVAGVVGDKMPRYCMFGDTVNTSSRMESHGMPGKIHVSPRAFENLKANDKYIFECRGNIEVKGKGLMRTWWLRGYSDGSKWNDEYNQDTQKVIKSSTFDYYQKHGIPETPDGSTEVNGHKEISTKGDAESCACTII